MRRAAIAAAIVLGILVLLVGALAWMATTPSGFRWLTTTVANVSGGRLAFEGVGGHLGAPIVVQKLTYQTAERRIEIDALRLEWQPRALWQRRIDVDLLAAQALTITTLKEDTQRPEAPASLRAAFDLRVRVLDVARLEIGEPGKPPLTFRNLKASLDGRGDRYRLDGVALVTPWADVEGALTLAKDAPFALEGRVDALRREPVPIDARLVVGGTLTAIDFAFDARAENMNLLARGEVAPFGRVRLPRLLVAGEGVDPRFFASAAPAGDFAFSGVFEGQPGERLQGTFRIDNRLAGRIDRGRLPVASVTGAVIGDTDAADFGALAIDLGPAGRLTGTGQWRDGTASLTLASEALDLAGLHGKLYPTRMRAAFELKANADAQTVTAHLVERWGQGSAVLSLRDDTLRLESANFAGKGGRLAATGELRLDAARAFGARFDLAAVDPAQFGRFPRGELNARGEVTGVLAPELQLAAQFTLPPGTLEGRPVRGQGRFRYGKHNIADADVDLDLAGNRARVRGSYGSAGDRLLWDVDAPALGRLNLGVAGSVKSRGSAAGAPAELQIEGNLAARELRFRDVFAADSLDVVLDMQATPQGAFNGQIDGRGLVIGGQRLSFIRATSSGRRDAHVLNVDLRRQDWRVTGLLAGGLDANAVWRGELRQAEAHGPWPMVLQAPAALVLSRTAQQVDDLVFSVAGGEVRVEHFARRDDALAARGRATNVPLAPLLSFVERPLPFTTDLRASAEWDLRVGDTVDGTFHARRVSGDVRVDDPALALALTTLTLDVDARANALHARLAAASRDAGQLSAEARTTLVREDGVFTLARTAPLTWNGVLDVPDLRLLKPFLPVGVRADARVAARLAGSGSLAAPRIDGTVTAEAIRFAMPEEGVSVTDGRLALVLDDDRVRVQEGELKGQSGRIVVSGEAQLRNPQAGLTATFEKFAASIRSDRRVTVSGTTRLAVNQQRLRLEGELRADRARLETPEASRPELSSDVVVVGQPPREPSAIQRMPLELDLKLDLGDDFLFKGSGLDAKLGGKLRVFTVAQTLRAEGRIRVVTGRYAAYGQTLAIERGELIFVGPVDDAGIDVLAVRTMPAVKAGVQVRGTVQRPLVTLYSDPPMPDTEKLAWLVLGHGLEGGSQQEFALLQLAAGALLSQAESVNLQTQIAEVLRIDTFGVRAGQGEDLATTVVSVGKRISSRATLSYEQSLDGLNQGVKVLYQLSPRVRLEAAAGQQQSSFDAFYTREYD